MAVVAQEKIIKPGYKLTEVGVIPEEWEVKNLEALVDYTNGRAHEKSISNYGRYIVVNSKFIASDGEIRKYSDHCFCSTSTGDVLMVMSDVPNGRAIAKCYWVERDKTYTVNQRICALSPRHVDAKFLFYKLNRNPFYLAFDDGAKQTNLRKDDVLSCPLGIPKSREEQCAIATALSNIDVLIASLDQLISKKRDLKHAVMQQLLTGRQRLSGFSGEWEVKSLFQLADQKKEFFDDGDWIEAEFLTESGIRLVQTGNVGEGHFTDKGSKKYISSDSFKKLGCKEVKIGDVLICRLAEPAGRACLLPDIGEARIITAVDVTIFRPLASVADRRYLVNVFNTRQWFSSVSERCGGSTRTRIARSELGKMQIKIPSLREQTAIADVLSDMDTEIAMLEKRRDKTDALKQGMMQELLSGNIRLV